MRWNPLQIGPLVLKFSVIFLAFGVYITYTGDQFFLRMISVWLIYLCSLVWSYGITIVDLLEQIRDQKKPKEDDEKDVEID